MFIQVHMLQSVPPGNLNRDRNGHPKKCLFGGVTRSRISSQCIKHSIRHSQQFREAYSDNIAVRTKYLPQEVANALKKDHPDIPEEELQKIMKALADKFKGQEKSERTDDFGESTSDAIDAKERDNVPGKTAQLVFYWKPYALRAAEEIASFREKNARAYGRFLNSKFTLKCTEEEDKEIKQKKLKKPGDWLKNKVNNEIQELLDKIAKHSELHTVDVGLFGRMTTSDLLVNVEATSQFAHAISTHEAVIESDFFTAMDDLTKVYAKTQAEKSAAGHVGSGENEAFFTSAVYYKYFNIDLDSLAKHLDKMRKHMPELRCMDAASVTGVMLEAAAYSNPSGKQNSMAGQTVNELILVEVSRTKQPVSYANAFLRPVPTGKDVDTMTESAKALLRYINSVAAAFDPEDIKRYLLAVGDTDCIETGQCEFCRADKFSELIAAVKKHISNAKQTGGAA